MLLLQLGAHSAASAVSERVRSGAVVPVVGVGEQSRDRAGGAVGEGKSGAADAAEMGHMGLEGNRAGGS